jgi:hypothetical protein
MHTGKQGWISDTLLQGSLPRQGLECDGAVHGDHPGRDATGVNPVGKITGRGIRGQDVVGGNVYASWFAGPLAVRCEVWGGNGPQPVQTMVQPAGGSYQSDSIMVGWHIVSGQEIAIHYVQPDGNSVINVFRAYENDLLPGGRLADAARDDAGSLRSGPSGRAVRSP